MSEAKTKELVNRLRLINDEGDPDLEGESILSQIRKLKDPAAFRSLLFLRATDTDWGTDEREEVVNSLATYPKKMFAAEVGKLAAELSRTSPELFRHLAGTIIGGKLVDLFLQHVPPLSTSEADALIARVPQFEDDDDEVKARVNALRDGIRARSGK
jgi:hypothetical protein